MLCPACSVILYKRVAFLHFLGATTKTVREREGFYAGEPKMRPPIASAGCFGEKGPTPNPGRGLRFPASRLQTRNSPHPHPNAAVKNRGLTAYNKTAGLVPKTQALPLL